MAGSINPIQILIDRCPSLEMLLLVGHAESDYVGFTEKYRRWLRRLRRPRLNDTKVRLELVTVLRREAHDESYALMSRTGSNSPLSAGDANGRIQQRARQHQLRTQVDDAIEAVDMLSDDEVSSDEP
uniref:Uncharacterized protein n=1 Tax=Kalmanozyma brasiliensis (strain GHG001) TaxID=1365824 RepID=V5EAH0_KALBG